MNDKKLNNLDKGTLQKLLNVCYDPDVPVRASNPDQERLEALEDLLASAFQYDSIERKTIPTHIDTLCSMSGLDQEITVRSLLFCPDAALDMLIQLQKYCKELTQTSQSVVDKEVASLVYYATITCALVYYKEKTTGLSEQALKHAYLALVDTEWLPRDFCELFRLGLQRVS